MGAVDLKQPAQQGSLSKSGLPPKFEEKKLCVCSVDDILKGPLIKMSTVTAPQAKKPNPVTNFFGNIFRWKRSTGANKAAKAGKPSKAAAAAAKAELDSVRPTETLAAFKRPAPPRKRKGSRPTLKSAPAHTDKHMSDLPEE